MTGGNEDIWTSHWAPKACLKLCNNCDMSASAPEWSERSLSTYLSEHAIKLLRRVLPLANGIAEPHEALFESV